KSPVAFGGYLLMNVWIVAGFGIAKGFWGGLLRLFIGTGLASVSTSYPKPSIGSYAFEASGLLMFVGSLFVAYTAWRLIEARRGIARSPAYPVIAMAAVLAVLGTGFVWNTKDRWSPPADGVVRVGVIVPRSGPYAILGGSFLKAVEMATEDLRNTRYQYRLITVDVGNDPRTARGAIQRAIRDDRIDAIVGGISLFGQVTKPLATAARIPHTCVCTVTSIGDGAYNFTNIPTPEAEATLWVRDARIATIASVVAPSLSQHPELWEGSWYTDSNLRDFGFKTRFEQKYPGMLFATHMMPYAYDDFNLIVQAFERGENPAVYLRNVTRYEGTAGTITRAPGSGNFQSAP